MLEGDDKYFEDINIFDNIRNKNDIIFLQVKGNDSKSTSNTTIIKKAMLNFLENKNIENINNFTFLVMTNKAVQSYFYNRTDDDKKKLIDFLIKDLEEVKKIKNTNQRSKIKNILLREITKNVKKNTFFIDNLKYYEEDKRVSFFKKSDKNFFRKLNKIILLIKNMNVIDFIDYKIIIYLLNIISDKDEFLNLLWKIELLSMNRDDLNEQDLKDKVKSINFDSNIINKIKFSDKAEIKYGKIF